MPDEKSRIGAGGARAALRIGTRKSELALRQTHIVRDALAKRGVVSEIMLFTTTGDERLDRPLSEIGGKGLFTAELEHALLTGRVDCCVHSLKDLPTDNSDGVAIVALLKREDPRDVLVVRQELGASTLDSLPAGARVGTSSLRRRAQLLNARSDLEVADLRGNVPTRLRKIEAGEVDAAILAAAGLLRLGMGDRIAQWLEPPLWLPAAGQGTIAVQARAGDTATRELLEFLHDVPTAHGVIAERSFLAALQGGCQVPIGALCSETAGETALHGLVASVDGAHVVRGSRTLDAGRPDEAGKALAAILLARGAAVILAQVRGLDNVPAPQPK